MGKKLFTKLTQSKSTRAQKVFSFMITKSGPRRDCDIMVIITMGGLDLDRNSRRGIRKISLLNKARHQA